jgi:GTP-binding protein HflX
VHVEDALFATLDPTTRRLRFPKEREVIITDTVGFIRQLPHGLVEAFRATLEETKDADLLLHVIDSQDAGRELHIKQVEAVLEEIGALAVPRIEVYNKIDLAPEVEIAPQAFRDAEGVVQRVLISATTGAGLDLLKEAIIERLSGEMLHLELDLLPDQVRQRALLFEVGAVVSESVEENGHFKLQVRLPRHKWDQVCRQDPELETSWKWTNS